MSHQTRYQFTKNLQLSPLIAAAVITVSSILMPAVSKADSYDERIKQLEQKISQESNLRTNTSMQAAEQVKTVDEFIAKLASMQAVVLRTEAQKNQATSELSVIENTINEKRRELGEQYRKLYIENNSMTTLEMLATSKNLSDFMSKNEFRHRIKQQVANKLSQLEQSQNLAISKQKQISEILDEQSKQQLAINNQKLSASQRQSI